LLLCFSFAQNLQDKVDLDNYLTETPVIVIITPPTGVTTPISGQKTTVDTTGIVGGERDLQLTAETGSNAVFSTDVGNGTWSTSTPTSASGFTLMQYDGIDGSLALSPNGLNNLNLKLNGADRFRTAVTSDIPTETHITVYEGSKICEFIQQIQGNPGVVQQFQWQFSAFNGSCTFQSVGAIEILLETLPNVDITFTFFGTQGPPVSGSVAPVASPTPGVCDCKCPKFKCGVVFKGPTDDDDEIDDDQDGDDEIVYRGIKAKPVNHDFDGVFGNADDVDGEAISLRGGLTVDHNDDDDDNNDWRVRQKIPAIRSSLVDDDIDTSVINSSSILSTSLFVIGAIVFVLF